MPFSWDLLLAKCLSGLCQKGYTIHMWIQCSLWGNALVLMSIKGVSIPWIKKKCTWEPPSIRRKTKACQILVVEGERWITTYLSNITKSSHEKKLLLGSIIGWWAEQCQCMKICKQKYETSTFLGPFFCPLGRFRNRHYVFSRCEIMNTGNIYGQIMPWSACSVGIRSVPIRNFPWSCTLKTKQKTFTVTKLARWKYCDLKESIPLTFTWLETVQ